MENLALTALENAATENAHIAKIQSELFEVTKLQFTSPTEGFNRPDSFGIYKKTGGNCLGTVGKVYEPIQPTHFLDSIISAVYESETPFDLSTLEYNTFKDDTKINFRLKVADFGFVNEMRKRDDMTGYLNFTTTFDGSGSTTLDLYFHRMLCANGMKISDKKASYKFKHTFNRNAMVHTYANAIIKSAKNAENFNEIAKRMNEINVTQKEIDILTEKITGYDVKNYADLTKTKRKNLDRINESIAREIKDTGANAWGLYNGFTRYTNHEAKANATAHETEEFILFGSGLTMNTKAQNYIKEFVFS